LENRLHPIPPGASEEEKDQALSVSAGLVRVHWRKLVQEACPEYPFVDLPIALVKGDCISFICLANTTHPDRAKIPSEKALTSLKDALVKDGWKGKIGWYELYDW
jgi:hypothetical protein